MEFVRFFILGTNRYFPDEPLELHMKHFLYFIDTKLFIHHGNHFSTFNNSNLFDINFTIPESGVSEGDIQAPLLVKSISGKNIELNGKKFNGDNTFNVIHDKEDSNSVSSQTDNIFYLQNFKSEGKANITTTFNPSLMPFALGFELKIENAKLADQIEIKTEGN
jgi:hypothetical protein